RPEPYLADRTRLQGVRFLPREGSLTRLVQTGRGTENNPSRMLSTGRGKETTFRHAAGPAQHRVTEGSPGSQGPRRGCEWFRVSPLPDERLGPCSRPATTP